jgi:hypothetical protein
MNKLILIAITLGLMACKPKRLIDPVETDDDEAAFFIGSWACTKVSQVGITANINEIEFVSASELTLNGSEDHSYADNGTAFVLDSGDKIENLQEIATGISFRWNETVARSNWTCVEE